MTIYLMAVNTSTFRKVVYLTLTVPIVGMAIFASIIIGWRDVRWPAYVFVCQLVVAYLAMSLLIEFIGVPNRSALTKSSIGSLFGLGLFLIGALAGSASSMVIYQDFNLRSYVFVPFFWLTLFGSVPALVCGGVGAVVLRKVA